MNTIETERLVRRIVSTLKGESEPSMAPKLAEDFNVSCSSAAHLLEQCRAMIEAGAAAQAIELAETPPNLLDLVTLLEFRQADEWRQYCLSNRLPIAEKLNPRAVSALNDCYTRGITPQHPLYAAYREAMLAGRDESALMALKSIVRLSLVDSNALSELERLDAKILAARLSKLDELLASDADAAVREVDSIEAFGFKSELSGEIWRRGQSARCAKLLAEAESLMAKGMLAEVVTQLDFLAQLKSQYNLQWPADWEDHIRNLQSWCRTETAARQKDQEYRGLLEQLDHGILASEAKDTRAKKITLPELKTDLEELHRKYRQIESFSRPIPDDLVKLFQKRCALVDAEIRRRSKIRLGLIWAGVAAGVVVLAVMVLALLGLLQANSLTAEINKALKQQEMRTLDSLIKQASGKFVVPTPRLRSAMAAAASEIARQKATLADFESAVQKLPAKLDEIQTLEQFGPVVARYKQAEQAHRAMSPALQKEVEPRLAGFRARWVAHCTAQLPSINRQLDEQITAAETVVGSPNNTQALEQFRAAVSAFVPKLERTSQTIAGLADFVKLRPELADRCNQSLERLRKDQAELGKLDAAIDSLSKADKIADYANIVGELAAVEVQQSDYVQCARKARTVLALKDDPDMLSRFLLVGTNSALGQSLTQDRKPDLIPPKLGFDARQRFLELVRDYALTGKHRRYRLYKDSQHTSYEEWITDGRLLAGDGWQKIPLWKVDTEGPCELTAQDYGHFNGQYLFANRKPAYDVQMTDLGKLTSAWSESGFERLIDSKNNVYKAPPLKVADSLCAATSASALMRAYLLNQLVSLMALDPEGSGLMLTPELRVLPEKLAALGAADIRSGDWFVPSRVAALQPKLDKYFATLQGVSFWKQASGLLNAMARAVKAGFSVVGHVRPDGTPSWNTPPANGYVFGYLEGSGEPGVLYVLQSSKAQEVNKPTPLSPLLLFQGDLPGIIAESGVKPDDPSFKGMLPPLFATPLPAQ